MWIPFEHLLKIAIHKLFIPAITSSSKNFFNLSKNYFQKNKNQKNIICSRQSNHLHCHLKKPLTTWKTGKTKKDLKSIANTELKKLTQLQMQQDLKKPASHHLYNQESRKPGPKISIKFTGNKSQDPLGWHLWHSVVTHQLLYKCSCLLQISQTTINILILTYVKMA